MKTHDKKGADSKNGEFFESRLMILLDFGSVERRRGAPTLRMVFFRDPKNYLGPRYNSKENQLFADFR